MVINSTFCLNLLKISIENLLSNSIIFLFLNSNNFLGSDKMCRNKLIGITGINGIQKFGVDFLTTFK